MRDLLVANTFRILLTNHGQSYPALIGRVIFGRELVKAFFIFSKCSINYSLEVAEMSAAGCKFVIGR